VARRKSASGIKRTRPATEPYAWLGAGALALGAAAVLAGGSGVAHAEDGSSAGAGKPKVSAHSSTASSARAARAEVKPARKSPLSAAAPRSPKSTAVSGVVEAAATRRRIGSMNAPATATATAADTPQTELEREQANAEFNMSVGWIPGVGTVTNGLSLVSDFLDFSLAAFRGDFADMGDEIGDMTIDVIGMIPIVGAPLAATIHWAIVPRSTPVEHAPDTVNDAFTIDEDTQLTNNVLTNDSDADGDTLTATLDTGTAHGNLTFNADGSFTYTPTGDFHGIDGFTYRASDGTTATPGTVTITVLADNDPPVAHADAYTIGQGGTLNVAAASGLLSNDTDVDNGAGQLTALLGVGPANGTLSLAADGSFTYTPSATFTGADSFTYRVSDGSDTSTLATATVTVTPTGHVNGAPAGGSFTAGDPDPRTGVVIGSVSGTDPDGDTLNYSAPVSTGKGTISINASTGSFSYTPTDEARQAAASTPGVDTDSFTVTVSDGNGGTTTVAVSVTIAAPAVRTIPGFSSDGPVVAPNGNVYQTVSAVTINPTTGAKTYTTRVVIVSAGGTTVTSGALGKPIGPMVFGPDGTAYQAVYTWDAATNLQTTAVLSIKTTGATTISNYAPGWAVGDIIMGSNGTAYLAVLDYQPSNTTVIVAKPTGNTSYTIKGTVSTGGYGPFGETGMVVGSDGTAYVTTIDYSVSSTAITRVGVVTPDGMTTRIINGVPSGPVVIGVDGSVYQVTGRSDVFGTQVTLITATGATTLPGLLNEGWPTDRAVLSPDGTIYQAIGFSGGVTRIAVVDSSGIRIISDPVAGGAYIPVTTADGTLVVVLVDETYSGTPHWVTNVLTVSSSGVITVNPIGALVDTYYTFNPAGPPVVAPNSTVYQAVRYDDGTYVSVVSRDGAFTWGYAGDPEGNVVVNRFGTGYLTLSKYDPDTGTYKATVVALTAGFSSPAEVDGKPVGSVSIAPDGTVYQAITYTDVDPETEEAATYTTVKVYVPGDLSNPDPGEWILPRLAETGIKLLGTATGSVAVAPDGALHLTTQTGDSEATSTTQVWTIDPTTFSASSAL
jgi:VCBS repeat-containing protein